MAVLFRDRRYGTNGQNNGVQDLMRPLGRVVSRC